MEIIATLSPEETQYTIEVITWLLKGVFILSSLAGAIVAIGKLGIKKKIALDMGKTFIKYATLDDLDGDGPLRQQIVDSQSVVQLVKDVNMRTMRIELNQKVAEDFGIGNQKQSILDLYTEYERAGGNHYIEALINDYLASLGQRQK